MYAWFYFLTFKLIVHRIQLQCKHVMAENGSIIIAIINLDHIHATIINQSTEELTGLAQKTVSSESRH